MLVAGWADGYRNAAFRVLERLRVPKRPLFGPWSRMAADTSRPGPRIDLVPEMVAGGAAGCAAAATASRRARR